MPSSGHPSSAPDSASLPLPKKLLQSPFRFYLGQYPRTFMLGILALFFTNLFDVIPPLLIAYGIDQIEQGASTYEVLKTTTALIVVLIFLAISRYTWRIHFGKFHHSAANDLRRRIFHQFSHLGPTFYSKKPVGELMSLITNDVNMFRMGIGPGVLILFDALFMSLMTLPVMFYLQPDWTWKTMIFLPLVPLLIRLVTKVIHARFKHEQGVFSKLSGVAQEIISGIRVIKGYALEPIQTKKFNSTSRDYEQACNRTARIDALFEPVMEFGVASGSVILLYVGSPEVIREAVTLGTFFAFHRYILRMVWPMTAVGVGVSHVMKGRASFQRITELLETPVDVPNSGRQSLSEVKTIEVKNLSFTYPGEDRPVLENISFAISQGQKVGIVGPLGSGKSTLLKLLSQMYRTKPGQVLINGLDVTDYDLEQVRAGMRFVPQDPFLFSETVIQNISMGLKNTPPLEEIEDVAKSVKIHQEILELPAKYHSQLGERGVNLSGGQKQRLTIARGLITKSSVLMFDDSLSAVDSQTEASIEAALNSAGNHKTTKIIVTHRMSSIQDSDLILVLNNGQLEAQGTHPQLLKSSKTYKNLIDLQNSASNESSGPEVQS